MKLFLLITAFFITVLGTNKPTMKGVKTTILFFNSNSRYGMGINEQLFWRETEHHDTLIITDKSYNDFLDKKFKLLKDTILFGGKDELRYGVAFIRQYNNGWRDTFYTSPSLRFWKKNNSDYVDTTGFFKKTFRSFLIYE